MNRGPEVWIARNRETGRETRRYVQVRITHRLGLNDLADALASAFCRNRTVDDAPLPTSMTWAEIRRHVVEEYEQHGENVWTWGEQTPLDRDECQAWAFGVVRAAVPDLIVGDSQ